MKGYAGFIVIASLLLPAAAHAAGAPLACTVDNEVALRAQVAHSVSGIKIAQYRADGALLETSAGELESLFGPQGCPEELKVRLCDADCYYQRASANLFRATGIPLLSSKSGDSPGDGVLNQQALLDQARQGILLVDEALARLPRQQVAGGGAPQKENAFNSYLKSLALLNGLKAKLLVAAGDTWYRAASVSQINRLNYAVGDVLDDTSPATGDPGDEYFKAMAYYDEAFWLTMEARATVPDVALFASELSALAAIDKEVERRLDSVRKGYLFIGIDPEDFTFHNVEDLGRQLWKQRGELETQEKEISKLLLDWKDRYKELADQNFDLANLANSRAIDNEVYKIARLQDEAGVLERSIEGQLEKVTGAVNKFDRLHQINVLQADLKKQNMDLKNQLTVIQGQKEQDLLTLHKEDVRDQLEDYRFNIDMVLAEYNFRMQIDSLGVQLAELRNRIGGDDSDIRIAQNRKTQLGVLIDVSQQRINAANVLVNKYRTAQDTVYRSEVQAMEREIAAVDIEKDYYTSTAQTFGRDVCAARAALLTKSKEDIEKIKACYESSCPGGEGLKTTINQIAAQNKAMMAAQELTINNTLTVLRTRTGEVRAAISQWNQWKTYESLAQMAVATAGVVAAIPDVTIGLMGPEVNVTRGLKDAAKILADYAMNYVQYVQSDIQFQYQANQEIGSLDAQVKELEGHLQEITAQKLIDQWATKKALAEVNVQLAGLDREGNQADLEKKVQKIACDGDTAMYQATAARLQAHRASLMAQKTAKSQESSLLNFDIQEQQSLRAQSDLEIRRLKIEQDQIDLEVAKIEKDRANLDSMAKAVSGQIARVSGFQSKVDGYKRAYDAKLAVLTDVKKKIEAKTINLSDGQAKYVTDVIANENAATFAQISDIRSQIERLDVAQALQQDITDIDVGMRNAVVANRNQIIKLAGQAPQSNANAIFWDFEQLAADLTHGAAEMLEEKRELLQNINFTYNLYRNRYNMLSDFTTDIAPIHGDTSFIRTSSDVTRVLGACGAVGGVGTSAICNPDSLTWSRSMMTGLNAEFTVEKNSGLVNQLLQDGRVRFEISPFGSSQEDSKLLGDFTLWDKQTMSDKGQMLLVHAMVGLQSGRCGSQQVVLRHLGSGIQFARLSEDSREIVPTLVVKKEVGATLPVYGDTDTTMSSEYEKFHQGSYTAEGLEKKLHEGSTVYPYVGYPLVGTYELVANDKLIACLANDATGVKLGFVFVRKDPPQQAH
jgi:hypothetical protein